jgi:hypothetical protein
LRTAAARSTIVGLSAGSVELQGLPVGRAHRLLRAPAVAYADLVRDFAGRVSVEDRARAYGELTLASTVHCEPRDYQRALAAWLKQGAGAGRAPGKTLVALSRLPIAVPARSS